MKWYCTVCGYVHEGPTAPEACPVCKAPAEKFKQMDEEASFATVHEMAKDEARHGAGFKGLLKRYF